MHRKVTEGSGKQVSERSRRRPKARRKDMCIHLCSSLDQLSVCGPCQWEAMCATTHIWIFQNTRIQHYVVNLEASINQFFHSAHESLKAVRLVSIPPSRSIQLSDCLFQLPTHVPRCLTRPSHHIGQLYNSPAVFAVPTVAKSDLPFGRYAPRR